MNMDMLSMLKVIGMIILMNIDMNIDMLSMLQMR